MIEEAPFEIPYRLETPEAIRKAMHCNLHNIGQAGYERMLRLALNTNLAIPSAMVHARTFLEKDFYVILENPVKQCDVEYREMANLDLLGNFSLIERLLPRIDVLAAHENLFSFLQTLPETMSSLFKVESRPTLETMTLLRKTLRKEILFYARAKKTGSMTVEEVKSLVVICTLFMPENEDVLQAVRRSSDKEDGSALFQNALAELLFCRIPRLIEGLVSVDTHAIREKLFSKISRLGISKRHQMNLFGYFKANIGRRDLFRVLDRIDSVAQRTSMDNESKKKLHDYIMSLKRNIEETRTLYRTWFLCPESEILQRLHVPRKVMQMNLTYRDTIMKKYARVTTLQFYPTKDYLDLYKCEFSSDCTRNKLGEQQLMKPYFFNIRIFNGSCWTGNIYMLDFTDENGVLLIDRIQIPRGSNADYLNFFSFLKEAFEWLFDNVSYRYILMPTTISNHASVQNVFNDYRKSLKKKRIEFKEGRECFESLNQKKSYHILTERRRTG